MLIKTINSMKKNEIAILSNIIQGQISGATKKKLKSKAKKKTYTGRKI